MERCVIYTDEKGFQQDIQSYSVKLKCEHDIKTEIKKLLPKFKAGKDFFNNVEGNFFKAIEKAYPKHSELMNATKIPEMLDMDISRIIKLASRYETMKDVKNVSISSYEILAETEEEIKQYKAVCKVIEAIREAEEICGFKVSRGDIMRGTKTWIYANMYSTDIRFNHSIILENRRYKQRELKMLGVV